MPSKGGHDQVLKGREEKARKRAAAKEAEEKHIAELCAALGPLGENPLVKEGLRFLCWPGI